jgi:hypothetical protein
MIGFILKQVEKNHLTNVLENSDLVVIHFFDNTDKTDITVLFELGTNFELF